MAIQNQGWAYVSGSGTGTPGGADTQVQYNDGGTLQGSSKFTFDGSDVTVTGDIAATTFSGDGSGLTNISSDDVDTTTDTTDATRYIPFVDQATGANGESLLIHSAVSINPSTGVFTIAGSAPSLGIGSAVLVEADMEKIDGITNGTAAASKALVLDASSDITGINNLTASYFKGDGSGLTNLPGGGGGGGGIFTELDSSNAYSTSSLSIGTSDAPGATLHISSSGDEALFRVDGLTETEPVLFVTGSRRVGIGTATPAYELDVNGNIAFGNDSGLGYLISRGATNTKLKFGADGADSIALLAGNVQLLLVDNDSPDKIVLGAAADNNIIVTGSLKVNGSISGSTTIEGASLSVDGDINASRLVLDAGISGGTSYTGSAGIIGGWVTTDGAVTAGSLTDGTATIVGGTIQGGTSYSGSTTIQGASLSVDGAVTGGSLTDGTATITAGAASGFTTIDGSGDLTMGTITMSGFSVNASGDTGVNSLDVREDVIMSVAGPFTDENYTISSPYKRVYLFDTSVVTQIILPALSASTDGLIITVKDATGDAAVGNQIAVTGSAATGDKIDNVITQKNLAAAYSWYTLIADNTNGSWWVMGSSK
jgi:hypothetical protein